MKPPNPFPLLKKFAGLEFEERIDSIAIDQKGLDACTEIWEYPCSKMKSKLDIKLSILPMKLYFKNGLTENFC